MAAAITERAISIWENIASSVDDILLKLLAIVAILVIGKLAIWILHKFIKKVVFGKKVKQASSMSEKKIESIVSLSDSVIKFLVWFFVIVAILEQFGISASSLLATAGIGGVALAFGAQDLVKDVVSGAFLFIENQYEIGDLVELAGIRGIVESINMRNTQLKAYTGEHIIIPNGTIDKVINFSKSNNLAVLDVGVAYEEDIQAAAESMLRTAKQYKDEHDFVLGDPEYVGVIDLGSSDVVLRVVMEVQPIMQYQTERELRQRIKENFDKENIEIPYQRCVVITK